MEDGLHPTHNMSAGANRKQRSNKHFTIGCGTIHILPFKRVPEFVCQNGFVIFTKFSIQHFGEPEIFL